MEARISSKQESLEAFKLSRREIMEALVRQGVRGLRRIRSGCRSFERCWEARIAE